MRPRPTVAQCRAMLRDTPEEDFEDVCSRFVGDERSGVSEAVAVERRRRERRRSERSRLEAMHDAQRELNARGFKIVAGADEVGRGALAGPVSAGAAVLSLDTIIEGLHDSKRLTPAQREDLDVVIREQAHAVAVAHVDAATIDRVGIAPATRQALTQAVASLSLVVDHVLVDGNDDGLALPCTAVVGGDSSCAPIAAASIVAKVARDALMRELESDYPDYRLGEHKGYSTPEHVEAIQRLGPSQIHRRSFAPCRQDPTLF